MSDFRSTPNAGNTKMNNGSQWNQQAQTPQYTLPGVINYLTSEFTNLERFKIMTNLEKSEMKYKIIQLQGEVNSLKYINNKQAHKIEQLQQRLQKLGCSKTGDDSANLASGDDSVDADTATNNSKSAESTDLVDSHIPLQLPEIDLLIIKKSRNQLTNSMKEIVHLLKTPSVKNINCLNLPEPDDVNHGNEFDVLINNTEDFENKFEFNGYHNKVVVEKPDYFSESSHTLHENLFRDLADVKEEAEPVLNIEYPVQQSLKQLLQSDVESDAETVIVDEREQHRGTPSRNAAKQYTNNNVVIRVTQESSQFQIQILNESREVFNQRLLLANVSLDSIHHIYPILLENTQTELLIIDKKVGLVSVLIDDEVTETVVDHVENIKSSDIHVYGNDDGRRKFALIIEGATPSWFANIYEIAHKKSIHFKEVAKYTSSTFVEGAKSIKFQKWVKSDDNMKFPKAIAFLVDGKSTTCNLSKTNSIIHSNSTASANSTTKSQSNSTGPNSTTSTTTKQNTKIKPNNSTSTINPSTSTPTHAASTATTST